MKKYFFLSGIIAPVVYLFTVILGGVMWKEYSHLTHAISELTASGSPNRDFLNILFSISGLFGIFFAISAFIYARKTGPKLIKISMGILIIITVLSFLWPLFPMDERDAEITIRGIIHLVLAGIVSPLTIICPLLTGFGFRKIDGFRCYGTYSIISAIIILISGGLAAYSASNGAINLGLYERITIGTYEQWMFFTAIKFLRDIKTKSKATYLPNQIF